MKRLYRIIGYIIGFTLISQAIPKPMTLENFIWMTSGGCVMVLVTILCEDKEYEY